MSNTNKKRLIQNIALVALIVALATFLTTKKEEGSNGDSAKTLYDESIGNEVIEITIHVEGRKDILLKNIDDVWTVVQPSEFVADENKVRHLFTILSENADTSYDVKGKDLASYGLDKERLSVSFNQVKLIFGEYNPVSHKRYIRKSDTLYLVSETITGLLQQGVDAFKVSDSNTSNQSD